VFVNVARSIMLAGRVPTEVQREQSRAPIREPMERRS
jgi:hypothetical protein